MIAIAVMDVLNLMFFILFFLSTLNRVGILPVDVVVVDDRTFCVVVRIDIIKVASVVNTMKDVLAVVLRFLFDAAITVVSIVLLWILRSAASSGYLAMVLYSGPGPLVLASPPATSNSLALVRYVKASLANSSEKPASTCCALVPYTGSRAFRPSPICRPMKPLLAITATEDEISLPSLVLNASISTAPSSPWPATPKVLSSLRLSGLEFTGKQACNVASSSSSLPSSPTIRQLKASPSPVPLISAKERAIAMLINVNGHSKFSDFPINSLVVERQLGQGGFGTVLLTRHPRSGKKFAVKRIEKHEDPHMAAVQKQYLRNEIEA